MARKASNRQNYLYLFLGIGLIVASLLWKIYNQGVLSFKGELEVQEVQYLFPKPQRIKIDSLGIDLEVTEGIIYEGNWQISETKATHLASSASPGEMGNIVIYAHNKNHLFGPIRWIGNDAIIELSSADGKNYTYQVVSIHEVNPKQIEFVLPKPQEVLTIYTCSGILDSKRYVVVAKPLK